MYDIRRQLTLNWWLQPRLEHLKQQRDHIENELNDPRTARSSEDRQVSIKDLNILEHKITEIEIEIAKLESAIDCRDSDHPDYYADDVRPYKRTAMTPIGNAVNRRLGPLPPNISTSVSTDELIGVRVVTPLLFIAYVGTLAVICIAPFVTPWLFYGITYMYMNGTSITLGTFGPLHAMAITYIGLMLLWPAQLSQIVNRLSTRRTNRYRAGVEAWSWKQRVSSNILSAADNIILFALFPLATLLIVSGVSSLLMHAYLLEHQVSGDGQQAKLATIKLHNQYTEAVLLTLAIIVLIPWLFQLIG